MFSSISKIFKNIICVGNLSDMSEYFIGYEGFIASLIWVNFYSLLGQIVVSPLLKIFLISAARTNCPYLDFGAGFCFYAGDWKLRLFL